MWIKGCTLLCPLFSYPLWSISGSCVHTRIYLWTHPLLLPIIDARIIHLTLAASTICVLYWVKVKTTAGLSIMYDFLYTQVNTNELARVGETHVPYWRYSRHYSLWSNHHIRDPTLLPLNMYWTNHLIPSCKLCNQQAFKHQSKTFSSISFLISPGVFFGSSSYLPLTMVPYWLLELHNQ